MRPSPRELRDRWNGEDARIAAIISDMREPKSVDWTKHLLVTPAGVEKPISFLEDGTRPRRDGEVAPRDLRGIRLCNVNLTGTSGFEDADVDYAILEDVYLGKAEMSGVSFRYATLCGSSSLYHANAPHSSFENASCRISLQEADLHGANIRGCDFRDADLRGTKFTEVRRWNEEGTFGLFSVRRLWTKFGGDFQTMNTLDGNASMRLRKYIAGSSAIRDLHREHPLLAAIWYCLASYGRSAGRLALNTAACWLFFAWLFVGRELIVFGEPCRLGIVDAMYLSVVTLTTLGYGDIVPATSDWLTRFLVGAEAVSGIILIGALIAILIENATINTD